jgi:hypothetical protein
MSDSDAPIFEWQNDKDAGDIIKRFQGSKAPIKESDPRIDILIDVAILLGTSDRVYFEMEQLELVRTKTSDYTQYTVSVDDGLVFDAIYFPDSFELGVLIHGPWIYKLATLVKTNRKARTRLIGSRPE